MWTAVLQQGLRPVSNLMPPGWHPAAVQPAPAQPALEQPGSGATAAPLEALSRIGVFQQLAASSLRSLAEGLQQLDVPAGGVVLREGEPGDALYLIAAGTLDVLVGAPPAVTTVARLGPGEFFGEVALLTGRPRTATVRAETAATLWALSADRLRAVMADDAVLSEIIRRTAYGRASRARERAHASTASTSPTRSPRTASSASAGCQTTTSC